MLSCNPEVVRELHLRIIRLIARVAQEQSVQRLRLDGGTALAAYYLGHRQSEDLDFFGDLSLNAIAFGQVAQELASMAGLIFESIGSASRSFARFLVRDANTEEAIRVDLAAASPFLLEPLQPTTEGIQTASFRDLAAGKLHALCDRFAERDFVDLHAILTRPVPDQRVTEEEIRRRFGSLVRDVIEVDPGLGPHLVGEGVSQGIGKPIVTNFPLRLLVPISEGEIQQTLALCFEEAARLSIEGKFGS